MVTINVTITKNAKNDGKGDGIRVIVKVTVWASDADSNDRSSKDDYGAVPVTVMVALVVVIVARAELLFLS